MAKELKKIISNTCICFTVIEFILLITAELMLKANGQSDTLVSFLGLRGAVLLLIATFVFNLLNYVFRIKSLSPVILRLIHYILGMFCAFLLAIIIPGNFNPRFIFVFLVLYTVIYIIVCLFAFIIKKITTKKSEQNEEYSPVFESDKR